MLSVEDAVEQVKQRNEDQWVSWALGRSRWPTRWPAKINLGAPKGKDYERNITAAKLWAATWSAAQGCEIPGEVVTESRRARKLDTYPLPTSWTLSHPLEALALTPKLAQHYIRARDRFAEVIAMPQVTWDGLDSIPLGYAKTIAGLSDEDWGKTTTTLTHIADGPGDAAILRELAVPGVHSKWIEVHASLLCAMLGVAGGPADAKTRLAAHIGMMAKHSPINVYLACPQLCATAAGLDRFAATVPTLNGSSLAPRAVLIIENRKFGHSFELSVEGLAVVYGLGYAATTLADLRWIAAARTVLYWGDLDRAGLAILALILVWCVAVASLS